jgi:hypothetical protein
MLFSPPGGQRRQKIGTLRHGVAALPSFAALYREMTQYNGHFEVTVRDPLRPSIIVKLAHSDRPERPQNPQAIIDPTYNEASNLKIWVLKLPRYAPAL